MRSVRPMAVAGRFYPADTRQAESLLRRALGNAPRRVRRRPRALVCPHAGWIYCLDLAALSWAQTQAYPVERVIFLGPSHHHRFEGWAIDDHRAWDTPLGSVSSDREFLLTFEEGVPRWRLDFRPHVPEHCVEVLLPWVRLLHPEATIVAAVSGDAGTEADVDRWAEILRPEDLLVVSSDLSHYLRGPDAERKDRAFLDRLVHKSLDGVPPDSACGLVALRLLVALADRLGWDLELLGYHHSGQVSGDTSRVVGYASVVAA